jgi:hypothetical protein
MIDKNTLKFGGKWGLARIKLVQYSSTKYTFKSEWRFRVWWGLSPLIPTKTVVPNKTSPGRTEQRHKVGSEEKCWGRWRVPVRKKEAALVWMDRRDAQVKPPSFPASDSDTAALARLVQSSSV